MTKYLPTDMASCPRRFETLPTVL